MRTPGQSSKTGAGRGPHLTSEGVRPHLVLVPGSSAVAPSGRPVDLSPLVADAIGRTATGYRTVTPIIAADAAVVDADLVVEILTRLLAIEVELTPPGVNLYVSVVTTSDRLVLTVEDDAPPPPSLTRRIGAGRPGAGLLDGNVAAACRSLAAVQTAVRRTGGCAWIEEAPDQGTCFVVELPAVPCPIAPTAG